MIIKPKGGLFKGLFRGMGIGHSDRIVSSGDVTVPTLTSSTIPAAGTSISLLFSEVVDAGAGGDAGWTVTMSGGASAMSYTSGKGSNTLVYALARTVLSNETGTMAYTQPGNGIEDASGNDLATISSNPAVTNSSTYTGGAGSIMNEYFEAVGYDCGLGVPAGSSVWTETVGVGSTVDEDAAVAGAGSPAGWGAQCLQITKAASVTAYTEKTVLGLVDNYVRIEVVVGAEDLPNSGSTKVVQARDDTDGKDLWSFYLGQTAGGALYFQLKVALAGAATTDYSSLGTPAVGTKYRIEVKWDITNNVWAWKIDGVAQKNNVDATDPVTSEGTLADGHATHFTRFRLGTNSASEAYAWTVYYDKVSIGAAWIGA